MTSLTKLMSVGASVLLVGPPGIGKTARIAAAAKAAGRRLVVIRASLSERVDLGGALIPDADAGVTRELPLERLADLQKTDIPTILLLDDLGQAPIDVQAACMRLFDPGYLSPQVLIWGATNRPGDKAGVAALCEPLRSRFDLAYTMPTPPQPNTAPASQNMATELCSWRDELDAWCAWALGAGVAPSIVAWHRTSTGRTLYQWTPCADPAARMPDYRSWAAAARLYGAGIYDVTTLSAVIGPAAAVEFIAFDSLTGKLPSVADIERDPGKAALPSEPAEMYLVSTALGAAMSPDNSAPLLHYLGRLPRVYCALAARDAYRRNGAELARTPAWSKWLVENQGMLCAH